MIIAVSVYGEAGAVFFRMRILLPTVATARSPTPPFVDVAVAVPWFTHAKSVRFGGVHSKPSKICFQFEPSDSRKSQKESVVRYTSPALWDDGFDAYTPLVIAIMRPTSEALR